MPPTFQSFKNPHTINVRVRDDNSTVKVLFVDITSFTLQFTVRLI